MTINGSKPWSKVVEIPAAEMPPLSGGQWFALFRELLKRLEETPSSAALAITMRDEKTLKSARFNLSRLFTERLGSDHVVVSSEMTAHGEAILYVRRGAAWGNSAKPPRKSKSSVKDYE